MRLVTYTLCCGMVWGTVGSYHPPVVFFLCRRNGNLPFRLCLPTAPPPLLPPPRLLRKPDALCLPLGHSPLILRGMTARGRRRVSPTWVLTRSPLLPPAIRWERRGGTLAFAGASDSAASSLLGVGVAGSLRSQESPVLADPSPVDSSVSVIVDHALPRLASLPGTAPAHTLHAYLPREVEILVQGIAVAFHGLMSRTVTARTIRGRVDEGALAVTDHASPLPV